MANPAIERNIAGHTEVAARYDALHDEIFNDYEQSRLREALARSKAAIKSADGKRALDFGCGTGNLTNHLLALGFDVTAADVTPAFLRMVAHRYGVQTIELAGGNVHCVPETSFDFIGVYSVLHHVPDYLAAARDLVGKLKHGGVLFIDHEFNENHWEPSAELAAFRAELRAARTGDFWDPEHKRWQYLLRAGVTPSRHVARYHRWRGISAEGDIHVTARDHIVWPDLISVMREAGAELVTRVDYLYAGRGDYGLWRHWRDRCSDMSYVIMRRT